ncbi:hypothetical protein BH20ACT15_BH20ACT15_07270 [soil metagenome]
MLIVQELGAPRAKRGRRRPKPSEPGGPDEVPVTRLTVVGEEPFEGERAATKWMRHATSDPEDRAALVRDATRLINLGLAAMRAEARDPLISDVGATRALRVRIGFGEGDALADGRWSEAADVPPPTRGRLDDVDPLSRVASVLAGRDAVHPAETLLERARLDTLHGRRREAELGLEAARAALAERPGDRAASIEKRIERASRELARGDDRG